MKTYILAATALGLVTLAGCSNQKSTSQDNTNQPTTSAGMTDPIGDFRNKDSTVQAELDKAAGYAILPDVGKGAAVVGGTYGTGDVYERGQRIGRVMLTEGTVGAQVGGQSFSELIIFKDQAALDKFKSGGYTFVTNASAVAIKQGSATSANYRDGVAVFVHPKSGLMAEAAIGGQRIRFEPR